MNKRAQYQLNTEALYVLVDKKRRAQKLLWRPLARDLGLSPSTFTRLAQGKMPAVDAFCTLMMWLGEPIEKVVLPSPADEMPVRLVCMRGAK